MNLQYVNLAAKLRELNTGFITFYGKHLGNGMFICISPEHTTPLSKDDGYDAIRNGIDFVPSSFLLEDERAKAHDCWVAHNA